MALTPHALSRNETFLSALRGLLETLGATTVTLDHGPRLRAHIDAMASILDTLTYTGRLIPDLAPLCLIADDGWSVVRWTRRHPADAPLPRDMSDRLLFRIDQAARWVEAMALDATGHHGWPTDARVPACPPATAGLTHSALTVVPGGLCPLPAR